MLERLKIADGKITAGKGGEYPLSAGLFLTDVDAGGMLNKVCVKAFRHFMCHLISEKEMRCRMLSLFFPFPRV